MKNGLEVLRAIARSDAMKDVRDRVRGGAMRVADNERVPRAAALAAGVLAALLETPDRIGGGEAEHEWSEREHSDSAERERSESGSGGYEDDPVRDDAAVLREIESLPELESETLEAEPNAEPNADGDEERLPRFEEDDVKEQEAMSSAEVSPAASKRPAQDTKPAKASTPRAKAVAKGTKGAAKKGRPAKASASKAPAATKRSGAKKIGDKRSGVK